MKSFLVKASLGFCGLLLSSNLAHATTIFTLGNNPSGDVNILLNKGTTGMTVQGEPNGSPSLEVNFTSTQILLEDANGQARVSANPEGTPLTNLSITLANGGSYGDLIINPFVGGPGVCPNCVFGNAIITVVSRSSTGVLEAPVTFTYALGNGNNFLTITQSGGESIVRTSISALGGFNDLRQPRISGPFLPAPVPEPTSLSLLGFGLVGAALFINRLRSVS